MSRRFIFCLLALLVTPVAALAQISGWSRPVEIKTSTRSNWFPTLAVDPWGNPHVVFATGTGNGDESRDLVMYTARFNDTWLIPNDILLTGIGGWAARNSLAIDRSGRLHLLARSRDHIRYTSADAGAAISAQAWTPSRVMNALSMPYYSAIAIDPSDILHAVYQELRPSTKAASCEGCSDVWYRRSLDGGETWSAPRNLSHGMSGTSKLQIVIHPRGMFVTWDEGKDPSAAIGEPLGIAYAVSRDQGATWEEPQRLRLEDRAAEQGTLGIAGSGQLVQVFRTTPGDELLYRVSDDQGAVWSEAAPVSGLIARNRNETPWDCYSMATDSAGNVHLLASARRSVEDANPMLFHVVWNPDGRRWETPQPVATNDLHPEWPQLVVANGNQLHATWFTRNADDLYLSDTTSAYRVWYSERQVDAPTTSVEIIPTATPVPTPTSLPLAAEQPLDNTATLVREALNAPLPESVRSEAPLLRSLFWALLPTLGILVVASALILWRRSG
jgi:hypothetical protein